MLLLLSSIAVLVIGCVALHLFALQGLSTLLPRLAQLTRLRVGVIVLGAIVAHLLEIALFALAFMLLAEASAYGALEGIAAGSFRDYLYYSAVTFTSLGYGDLTPTGPLRLLAACEALTGLVLITWTASFVFLVMQRHWLGEE